MGGVGGKLLFVLKSGLKAGEHPVKFGCKGVDLIPPLPQIDPAGEIVARTDLLRGADDPAHRPQRAAGQQITAKRREQQIKGQNHRRELQKTGDGAVHSGGLADAPHPIFPQPSISNR